MSYSEHWAPREVYEAHLQWGKRFPAVPPAAAGPVHHEPGRRIRVGYLSPDYWRHPVAHFMEPVLRYHDRARFEIFCYHTGVREDEVTARLKTLPEHWRALPGIADDELEARLRGDKIEILVELSGHTDGTRLPVLARRIAPVQVSYLGYPNTTGLAAMDYRITDACADPAGESDQLHTEKLIRLPGTFLCYAPPIVEASNRIPPSRRKRYVTFGSFNNFAKISPTSIRLWASILASVPGSKLFIKTHGLQDPGLRALLQERLQGAGVPADRLLLAPPTTDHRRHLETYDEVDVALDTFPYHGTTTTLDALWMGVPVVTLIGDRHASRVGLSILSGLGLNELIAHTHDEYVACAVRLAFQPEQLEEYAHDLRARLAGSALTDGKRFTAHLEEAFLQLWQAPARPT
jgi:predicted O-linked N-acetylglucosamine transferase (SPINDLY family)